MSNADMNYLNEIVLAFTRDDVVLDSDLPAISDTVSYSKTLENNIASNPTNIVEENSASNNELKELICDEFGFGIDVLDRLKECSVDVESLMLITDSDLNELFPITQLGTRIKFKHVLRNWKNSKASTVSSYCSDWVNNSSNSSAYSSTSKISSTRNDILVPLVEILKQNPKGNNIMDFYTKNNTLLKNQRDDLINTVVDHFSSHNIAMSMKEDYYYFNRGCGKNPSGKLHDKAVNARTKLRKRNIICSEEKNQFKKPKTPEKNSTSAREKSNTEIENIIWLKHNNSPWSEVEVKWMETFEVRRLEIREGKNTLENWPLFKHCMGHALIELDYNRIYPNQDQKLFREWGSFKERILPYFKDNVKDIYCLKLLNSYLQADSDSQDCITVLLLHAILKPTVVTTKDVKGKNVKKWKPTITDAQESTILHVNTINDYERKINLLREKYLKKGLKFQPILIVIGDEILNLTHFYTYFEGTLYKFPTFLKCLDIIFKCIHVLDFEYPFEGKNIFQFFENYFYNLKTNSSNPNITNLLEYLKK